MHRIRSTVTVDTVGSGAVVQPGSMRLLRTATAAATANIAARRHSRAHSSHDSLVSQPADQEHREY